jgi:uncharacterized Zn finger protein (UPF0148 family)
MKKYWKIQGKFFIFLLILFITINLLARAGGAGGDGGGEGGGGGDLTFLFMWILSLPFPWNIISIGILILVGLALNAKAKEISILNQIPPSTEDLPNKLKKMEALDPNFNIIEFSKKVNTAFFQIQEAWSKQSIRSIRKFISDGLYQRFTAQFIMMKEIEQENIISNIKIHDLKLIDVQVDGNYFVIDIAIHASMNDRFVSKKYKDLNQGGIEDFVEIWTFVRKIQLSQQGDLYHNIHCPQCGAPIEDLEGEIAICPYCKTILNTGEFDWILCEITQADDYPIAKKLSSLQSKFQKAIEDLYARDPHFSVQLMEDKASNAIIQILIAEALNDPKRIRRFSSDEFYNQFEPKEKLVFHRFYLNYVTLIGLWQYEEHDYASFYIKATFQRLKIENDKYEALDMTLRTQPYVLILKRHKDAILPTGKIYAHQCPNCGGILEDTTDITCPYCGATLNSPKYEWIVYSILTPDEYEIFLHTNQLPKKYNTTDDDVYKIRDYVINNTCVILGSDGEIDEKEMEYVQKLARKLGYSINKIEGLLKLAKQGKLKLIFPVNKKDQEKVFAYMQKAAEANNEITQEELEVLHSYKKMLN